MEALVTGCGGFIGSTLCDALLKMGYSVKGVDSFTPYYDSTIKRGNLRSALNSPAFQLIEADLLDGMDSRMLGRTDVVFHQAAQPGVRGSWRDGFSAYVRNNIVATQHVLEAILANRPEIKMIYASSSSVYGNHGDRAVLEERSPTEPHSPYGVTKLGGEHLCRLYSRNFGLRTTSLRYFTVYGPRQRPDMAINRLILSAQSGQPFPLYGTGEQQRDFTYVDDVVAANIAAFEADTEPGLVVNVAGGVSVALSQVVAAVESAVGSPVQIEPLEVQAGDPSRTSGSIDRARAVLGWEPTTRLDEGVRNQVEWQLHTGTSGEAAHRAA